LLKDDSEITKILDLPFFNDNIKNKELYHSALRLNDPSTAVIIDPSKMDDVEYLQEISKQIKDQIDRCLDTFAKLIWSRSNSDSTSVRLVVVRMALKEGRQNH
jgi:hypothetical protein